ncbi:MAG: pilus assembly protein TadE, partial [Pseudomonadota bacterium]
MSLAIEEVGMTLRTDSRRGRPQLPKYVAALQTERAYGFHGRQRGAFAIMLGPLLIVMAAFSALAVDIGLLFSRNVDLNGIAKAAALAAARELNGTAAGITAARTAARATAERLSYQNGIRVTWRDEALTFGTASTSNDWVSADTALTTPLTRYFARVDTRGLGDEINSVSTSFMPVLSQSLARIQLGVSATAGKTAINISPIAICAMSPDAATPRTNPGLPTPELVEYGFRRGVSYDLMQLNPNGITPVRYLINPVSAPGAQSIAFNTSIVGPFMCVGRMWMPGVQGDSIRVSSLPSSAPLGALSRQLNSRFDDYPAGLCNSNGAPPDFNIKPYAYNVAGKVTWMSPGTGSPAALPTTDRQRLETIADLPTPPGIVMPG